MTHERIIITPVAKWGASIRLRARTHPRTPPPPHTLPATEGGTQTRDSDASIDVFLDRQEDRIHPNTFLRLLTEKILPAKVSEWPGLDHVKRRPLAPQKLENLQSISQLWDWD